MPDCGSRTRLLVTAVTVRYTTRLLVYRSFTHAYTYCHRTRLVLPLVVTPHLLPRLPRFVTGSPRLRLRFGSLRGSPACSVGWLHALHSPYRCGYLLRFWIHRYRRYARTLRQVTTRLYTALHTVTCRLVGSHGYAVTPGSVVTLPYTLVTVLRLTHAIPRYTRLLPHYAYQFGYAHYALRLRRSSPYHRLLRYGCLPLRRLYRTPYLVALRLLHLRLPRLLRTLRLHVLTVAHIWFRSFCYLVVPRLRLRIYRVGSGSFTLPAGSSLVYGSATTVLRYLHSSLRIPRGSYLPGFLFLTLQFFAILHMTLPLPGLPTPDLHCRLVLTFVTVYILVTLRTLFCFTAAHFTTHFFLRGSCPRLRVHGCSFWTRFAFCGYRAWLPVALRSLRGLYTCAALRLPHAVRVLTAYRLRGSLHHTRSATPHC